MFFESYLARKFPNYYLKRVIKRNHITEDLTKNTSIADLKDYLHNLEAKCGFQNVEVIESGSHRKGTLIKGGADIDFLVGIDEPNLLLLKMYNNVFDHLSEWNYSEKINVEKRNVSIRLTLKNKKIDVVPAKFIHNYQAHHLYPRRLIMRAAQRLKQKETQEKLRKTQGKSKVKKTEPETVKRYILIKIDKQLEHVENSQKQKEIVLAKIWRNRQQLKIPSVLLENIVIEALDKEYNPTKPIENLKTILEFIDSSDFEERIFIDPGNGGNILSELITKTSKKDKIRPAARMSLNQLENELDHVVW